MKRWLINVQYRVLLAIIILTLGLGGSLRAEAELVPPKLADLSPQMLRTPILVTQLLQQHHFLKRTIDRPLAEEWIKAYMESLDITRTLFYQSDVKEMQARYAADLAQKTARGDVTPAFEIFEFFVRRVEQREAWIRNRLNHSFDFSKDEDYEFDRSRASWPANAEDADALWERRLKFDLLQHRLARVKKDDPLKVVQRRYNRLVRTATDYDSEDILQTYLSALAGLYDPHSQYMGPSTLEDFAISMKLSLVGIGAVLSLEDGYCTIREIIPGGPADMDKRLKPNDKILAVAQGEGEYVDVVDMKLRNTVKLIRGAKGTPVQLKVNPVSAGDPSVFVEIKLTRDTIELTAQQASARIVPMTQADGRVIKVGWLDLPSFYGDVRSDASTQSTDAIPHSTTEDVALLIDHLKKEGMEALILDLRRNGGGLLEEAVNLTGLFIERGPVVQVKDSRGSVRVLADKDPSIRYHGPLIVLTSRFSASASEIVAGALQNYGRALIVGDQSTHGKGTVQAVLELGRFLPATSDGDSAVGAMKITIQKFYLPNGDSTQNRGVVPDISLPSPNDYLRVGESDTPRAMPWDQIRAARFRSTDHVKPELVATLASLSKARVSSDPTFSLLNQEIQRLRQRMETGKISLNEQRRIQERETEDQRRKQWKALQADAVDYKKLPRYIVKQLVRGNPFVELSNLPEPIKREDEEAEEEEVSQNTSDIHLTETLQIAIDWLKGTSPQALVNTAGLD